MYVVIVVRYVTIFIYKKIIMNQVPEEEKTALTKTFAIVGFTALLIFVVWLTVQLVSIIPGAFSSLASLANSVYNYDAKQELVVSTGNSVVNAGEAFTIMWSDIKTEGTYTFMYTCTEGVALDVKNSEGKIVSLDCNEKLELGNATSLEALVASEKYRFVDIPYTITFTKADTTEAFRTTAKTITIVNATVPTTGSVVVTEPTAPTVPTTPTVVTPTPKPTYVPPKTITVSKVVYTTPVSNPNGYTDLQVTLIGVGSLSTTRVFTPSKTIDADTTGAIQFEVKNIGTKTSSAWNYIAHLPSDITYTSPLQVVLKPQERAIITLGFNGIDDDGTERIDVTAVAVGDIKIANNVFVSSVQVVN